MSGARPATPLGSPPATVTPGQAAYEAFYGSFPGGYLSWEDAAQVLNRSAWDAAAQAAADAALPRVLAENEHLKAALAGDNEGVRLWMLDCGQLVDRHRAKTAQLRDLLAEILSDRMVITALGSERVAPLRQRAGLGEP